MGLATLVGTVSCGNKGSDATATSGSPGSTITVGAGTGSSTGSGGTQPFTTRKVEVDGHQISLACKGTGPKTVVFVSDVGQTGAQAWSQSKVPDGLADQATVCVYDRPGLGESDAATTPRSIANQVKELTGLLSAAGVKAPIYLVAQGYGTFIARQFAKEQRPQVGGMVLVDPPLWGLDLATPVGASPGVVAEYASLAELNKDLASYGAGALPPPPAPTIVLGIDGTKAPLPDTAAGTDAPFSPTTTTFPLPDPEKRRDDQKQLAQKSPFGKFEYVESAGSYAQYWSPDAVVDAVKKVLANNTR